MTRIKQKIKERDSMPNITTIPYVAYESTMARAERTQKRLIITLGVSIILSLFVNTMWFKALKRR